MTHTLTGIRDAVQYADTIIAISDLTRVDEITEALRDVLEHKWVREEMSMRGLKRAEGFSWDKCAKETLAIYRKAREERH